MGSQVHGVQNVCRCMLGVCKVSAKTIFNSVGFPEFQTFIKRNNGDIFFYIFAQRNCPSTHEDTKRVLLFEFNYGKLQKNDYFPPFFERQLYSLKSELSAIFPSTSEKRPLVV